MAAPILVVDDILANRALAAAALEDAGYRVVEASDGAEALALFAAERPACVLLDVRMPGMDGFEVCRRMRAMPGGDTVPVLFVTALRDLDTFEHALTAGGFDYLTKPVRPSDLIARVRAAVLLDRTSAERDELAELLRHQRDDFMRAMLLNERLAAFLVHDLKSPIASMVLGAGRIMRDLQASERTRDVAARIKAQASDLSRMILGLLDLSKGAAGELVLSRTSRDLDWLVREVLDGYALRAAERSVELVAEASVGDASIDVNLMRRVVENLVDNALRHAPRGSSIVVTTWRDAADVGLRVADQGGGVAPELRERVFDRFVQRPDPRSRASRGLDLAFCKLVIEAHGGRIWIEDGSPGAVFCARWSDAG